MDVAPGCVRTGSHESGIAAILVNSENVKKKIQLIFKIEYFEIK